MRAYLRVVCAVGIFCALLALSPPSPVQADDEIPIIPYDNGSYRITQDCHPDGWGTYVGGISSTCAVDLSVACGAAIKAPVSGNMYTLRDDGLNLGNTAAIIKGRRYWIFMLHDDYIDTGNVIQGQIIGTEASYGNSTGCHVHLSIFDSHSQRWVNPLNLAASIATIQTEVEAVPDLPESIVSQLNFTVVTTSVEATVTRPAATPIQEHHPPPDTTNLDMAYILSWVFLVTAIVSTAMIGFGNKSVKIGGLLILIALGLLFISMPPTFQFRLEKIPSASPQPTATNTPEIDDKDTVRQAEDIVFTDVMLTSLPGRSDSHPLQATPQGECRISPNWQHSIQQWCPWITTYAELNGLDPNWIAAVMKQESEGNPLVMSNVSATGLIQVMPSNGYIGSNDEAGRQAYIYRFGTLFDDRPTIEELRNPEFNLAYGTAYLGGLLRKYGSMWEALLHYGGPGYGDVYRSAVKHHYDTIMQMDSNQ